MNGGEGLKKNSKVKHQTAWPLDHFGAMAQPPQSSSRLRDTQPSPELGETKIAAKHIETYQTWHVFCEKRTHSRKTCCKMLADWNIKSNFTRLDVCFVQMHRPLLTIMQKITI